MRRRLMSLSFAAAVLVFGSISSAIDRLVPSEYPTIQAAIDAAVDGDKVIIAPGKYTGDGNRDIDFKGKAITVQSFHPHDWGVVAATIIDCQANGIDRHRAFEFERGEGPDSVLAGLTIMNSCMLLSNGGGSYGGAVYCHNESSPTVTHCLFIDNKAAEGGAIYCGYGCTSLITNCLFVNNDPAAISTDRASAMIRNCVFWGNRQASIEVFSGEPREDPTQYHTRVTNCILWTNKYHDITVEYATLTVSYCDVKGGQANVLTYSNTLVWGEGNIDADPLFADPVAGDFHLSVASPCIDAGDPKYVPKPEDTDLDGGPRVINGRIDMGVDEFDPMVPPFIALSERRFDFVAHEGGPDPMPQVLHLYNGGGGILEWEIIEDCPWLSIEPTSGRAGTEVNDVALGVDVTGMRWGEYNYHIVVADPCAINSPRQIEVNLDVIGPIVSLSPNRLSFTAFEGGANPPDQVVTIKNAGGGTLYWQASCNQTWLRPVPDTGVCFAGQSQQVTPEVDTTGLIWGRYECKLTISDPNSENSSQVVGIDLDLGGPVIELSSYGFGFRGTGGTAMPAQQTFIISNTGGGVLNWHIQHSCGWLRVIPAEGSLRAAEHQEVVLIVSPAVLSKGLYTCQIQVVDRSAQTGLQRITVSLLVEYDEAALMVPLECGTIQQAINEAVDGDMIIIAPGIYTGPGNRDIDLKGKAITIRSVDPNDPNIVAATVIDCESKGRGFYLKGCSGATISGLTITHGLADSGAGIYCEGSEITLYKCCIEENATLDGLPGSCPSVRGQCGGDGGGLYLSRSSVRVISSLIRSSTTGNGGAGSPECYSYSPSSSWYTYGGDGGYGGGIACRNNSVLEIEDSVVAGNTTGQGGYAGGTASVGAGGMGAGIFCDKSSLLKVRNCLVSSNTAGRGGRGSIGSWSFGGGIYCSSGTVVDSQFHNNKADAWSETGFVTAFGGGMYIDGGNMAVSNSVFSGNMAGLQGGWDSYGGALCIRGGAHTINNCTFDDNHANWGTALDCWGYTLEIRDCQFFGNSNGDPTSPGCAIDAGGGKLTVAGCTICRNQGGGIEDNATNSVISDCFVENNIGPGIRFSGENYTITRCVVTANQSDNYGGITCHSNGKVAIADCKVTGNTTNRYGCAGIELSGYGVFTLRNCLITGNASLGLSSGGGLYLERHAWPVISQCTITGNVAAQKGGGMFCTRDDLDPGYPVLINSIVWGNSAPHGSEIALETYCNSEGNCFPSSLQVIYSSIQGGSSAVYVEQGSNLIWGIGNSQTDPLFVRPGCWTDVNEPNTVVEPDDPNAVWINGDYHLSQVTAGQAADSPCVDAGSDLTVNLGMDEFTTRTDNVADTGIVDMGYHYPMPNAADIDGDGDVDLTDFAILAGYWELPTMEIPMGSAIVDGDISEWSEGVNWIPLDKIYYGNPADVRDAKYALRWSPDTDKIYVAVMVNDSNHVFSDEYIKWDVSDRIEIYSQGDAEGGTTWLRVYDVAQQYMMAPNTSGGSWATWAYGEALGTDVGLEYAVAVNGDQIIHEAGVLMFDNYAGFSGGTTIVTELKPGHVVGFDVLVSSRWESDGFGMLSENLMTGKSEDAAQFARYTLAERTSVSPYAAQAADLDESGIIDWFDLAVLAENWLWHTRW